MFKEDSTGLSVNRRTMLKGAGAGLGTAGGLGSAVQSVVATRTPTDEELDRLEDKQKVQTILSELGLRRIPNRDTAEVRELNSDGADMAVTTVEFDYGTLQVGRIGDGVHASFTFENAAGNAPRQYGEMPPEASASLMLSSPTEVEFTRMATERERSAILSSIPVRDDESVLTYVGTHTDGDFWVDVRDESAITETAETPRLDDDEMLQYTVDAGMSSQDIVTDEHQFTDISANDISVDAISGPARAIADVVLDVLKVETIDELQDTCGDEIGGCVADLVGSLATCYKCAPACTVGASATAGIICFLCVFGICSQLLTGYSCGNAADCVTESDDIPDISIPFL